MTKAAQNLLLILVGAAVLWITLATDEYLNYVRPGFRYLLVPAAVAVVVLGLAGLRREWRDEPGDTHAQWYDDPAYDPEHVPGQAAGDHGHDHARGPRVAWLMCLPAVAIFVIAPPALGSFTASRNADRVAPPSPPAEGFSALRTAGGPVPMTLGEFVGRSFEAQTGNPATLRGVTVRLTGFVAPGRKGGWNLTRLRIMCCAGDAIPLQVIVVGGGPKPPTDSWVQVTGVWLPPAVQSETGAHQLQARSVTRISKPRNSYE